MKRFGPGRVRVRLAEMLAARLHADGYTVRFNPETLRPAQGYWRTDFRADVYRWEGSFEIYRHEEWTQVMVDSWSTMTDCIRGFDYEWDRPYHLEVFARQERLHPVQARAKKI
jgi:hypothetical protein